MNTESQAKEQNKQAILEQFGRTELLTLIKEMIQIHPDLAQLINSLPASHLKPQPVSLDPELYRLKVEQIFSTTDRDTWGSESRAAGPLLDIIKIADEAVEQQDYTNATIVYEAIIRGIIDNYDTFRWHNDEGDLDEVIEEGVDGLDKCLQGEQRNTSERTHILQILYDIYDFDVGLNNDEPVMSRKIPTILVRHTTSDERKSLATRIREAFELDVTWTTDDISKLYDSSVELLLGLEADTIDDGTFLRICRETENYPYLIERLLKDGRQEEALAEAQQVNNYGVLEIADILCEQGHEAAAVHLIEKRSAQSEDQRLLQWLQRQYQARGNVAGALEIAGRLFRISTLAATIERYREIHQLAEQLGCWETVQSELLAYVQQSHNIKLQIEIALNDKQVKEALELLQSQPHPKNLRDGPYDSNTFEAGLAVAQAAEENYPQEAIEIYQKYVETRIAWRGRENYQTACQYLTSIHKLFQKIGRSDLWTTYITKLSEQNRNLPALKDEMAKAMKQWV